MPNKPDIMCLSKALTAGIMPMAVTTCTQEIYDALYENELSRGFFHGHTYSGNPLGCAVAAAGIDLLTSSVIQESIQFITQSHKEHVKIYQSHNAVEQVRSCGVILAIDLAIEMERYGSKRNEIFKWFMNHGIFLRPLGKTVYIVPPYTTTPAELDLIYKAILVFLDDIQARVI